MMSNKSFLQQDFINCNFFQSKFESYSVIIDTPHVASLNKIFLKKLNTVLNKNINFEDISNVHKMIEDEKKSYDLEFGVNELSKNFYEMGEDFQYNYITLLKEDIRKFIGEDFYFQKNPTLRVQVPHKTSEIFYPFFHSDIQLGHPPFGINLWIPLNRPNEKEGYGFSITSLKETIKIFEELNFEFDDLNKNKKKYSEKLKNFSKVQNFNFGKSVIFDSRCLHSTLPLINHSRASIDVRIIPVSEFKKSKNTYQGTGRKKVLFIPGEGYHEMSIDKIKL
ncbi:hypothetical protein [Candidatus Pelagibacter sp. HIMB1542]|uniref:hypothetical protein n=1 Tax=Candidatus Pelagibacter sp. HIMB1542 TaxID=3413346 RepID=UPI003F8575BE